jgi:hypothetical protein
MPDVNVKELAKKMGDPELAVAHHAYRDLENVATRASAPGNGERAQVAAALAAELNARGAPRKDRKGKQVPGRLIHSTAVRNKLIRLMNYVAGDDEVPVLAGLIKDLDLREMVRFTLDRVPSDAATEALIQALDEVGPDFRVGIIGGLAKRRGAHVEAALKKAAADEAKRVRIAAVEALACFADPSNDAIIAKATKADCRNCRARAHKARVRLAGTLAKAGNEAAARRIYNAIRQSDAGEPQKEAARIGLQKGG